MFYSYIKKFFPNLDSDINDKGKTFLHLALARKNIFLASYLVNKASDLNIKDKLGYTPLMEIVETLEREGSHLEKLEFINLISNMLDRGANPNLTDNEGNSALHKCQFPAFINILAEHNANINACNGKGQPTYYRSLKVMENIHNAYLKERKKVELCISSGMSSEPTEKISDRFIEENFLKNKYTLSLYYAILNGAKISKFPSSETYPLNYFTKHFSVYIGLSIIYGFSEDEASIKRSLRDIGLELAKSYDEKKKSLPIGNIAIIAANIFLQDLRFNPNEGHFGCLRMEKNLTRELLDEIKHVTCESTEKPKLQRFILQQLNDFGLPKDINKASILLDFYHDFVTYKWIGQGLYSSIYQLLLPSINMDYISASVAGNLYNISSRPLKVIVAGEEDLFKPLLKFIENNPKAGQDIKIEFNSIRQALKKNLICTDEYYRMVDKLWDRLICTFKDAILLGPKICSEENQEKIESLYSLVPISGQQASGSNMNELEALYKTKSALLFYIFNPRFQDPNLLLENILSSLETRQALLELIKDERAKSMFENMKGLIFPENYHTDYKYIIEQYVIVHGVNNQSSEIKPVGEIVGENIFIL
jgi:hypothetical protein